MSTHRDGAQSGSRRWILYVLVLLIVAAAVVAFTHFHGPRPRLAGSQGAPVSAAADVRAAVAEPPVPAVTPQPKRSRVATHAADAVPSVCAKSSQRQHVFVSIGKQHAWMCSGTHQVYDTNVTTGASANGDGTPIGTWQLLAKETNRWLTVLSGDSFFVKYWMPYNGPYGFHDSSWQTFAYGSPQYRTAGSHGCVHLPATAMRWLYNWAQLGATVTIRA
jgi:lipoprotein-anchoring transpeptidase ErfK/SrfK